MKLHPFTWIAVGVCIALIFLSYALIVEFLPNRQTAANYREYAQELKTEGDKMPQVEERYDDAVRQVNETAALWQAMVAAKTPPQGLAEGGIDLTRNRYQLTVDAFAFRNIVQRAVNERVKIGGVEVIQGPLVPFPSEDETTLVENYFNLGAFAYPVAIFELGTVTVQGTLDQILKNARSWAEMPNYLAVTDGLTITGTAPELTGTYNLVIVAFIRGDAVSPPVVAGIPEAAEGGAGPAGSRPGL